MKNHLKVSWRGFFRENLSITYLWLICQYSAFQSSSRKPEDNNIAATGREGHVTRCDLSCCVESGHPWYLQNGAEDHSLPFTTVWSHHRDHATSLPLLPWATSSVLAMTGASDKLHLSNHFEFPPHWHLGFKTIQSTVNRAFFYKKKKETKNSQEVREPKHHLNETEKHNFVLFCFLNRAFHPPRVYSIIRKGIMITL